MTLTSALAAT